MTALVELCSCDGKDVVQQAAVLKAGIAEECSERLGKKGDYELLHKRRRWGCQRVTSGPMGRSPAERDIIDTEAANEQGGLVVRRLQAAEG